MPRMSGIDPKSQHPTKTYFAPDSEMLVLNLWNEPPVYDTGGRIVEPGKDRKAYFDKGFYRTNREKEIEAIEASYAFKHGEIHDYDSFTKSETEAKVDTLIEMAADPEIKKQLLEKLKGGPAEKEDKPKVRKSNKPKPTVVG